MNLTQAVLLAVIIVLAIFLVVIGFQVFFVMRDLRKTLTRMNKLFDDTDDLVSEIKKPITTAGHLFTSLTAGIGIAHLLKKGEKHERGEK